VLEKGAIERQVYLPAGAWYDFWTNDLLAGGQTITVTAPLERLPLFVRAGAVLPMWPEMQYVDVDAVQTLTLRVYPGEYETTLYEDAGEGLDYEDGDYRWVYVACERDGDKLIINRRTAGRYEPPYQSIKLEVMGLNREPSEVRVDRQGAPVWFYEGDILELTVDTFRRVEIMIPPVSPHEATLPHRPR
jgi:alpha-glucosidase